jgi:hypothetical protein
MKERAFPALHVQRITEYDVEIDKGAQHKGISALVDLIASASWLIGARGAPMDAPWGCCGDDVEIHVRR